MPAPKFITYDNTMLSYSAWDRLNGFHIGTVRERIMVAGWCVPCSVRNPKGVYCSHAGLGTKKYRRKGNILYYKWNGMIQRCENPNNKAFMNYGGRGIRVCDRWRKSFDTFVEDMGHPPTSRHSLDRINNDGDYSPENCRWATFLQQNRNKRDVLRLSFNGKTLCVSEWEQERGFKRGLIVTRLTQQKWCENCALNNPVGVRCSHRQVRYTPEQIEQLEIDSYEPKGV